MTSFYVKRKYWKIFFSSLVFLAFLSVPFLSFAIKPAGNIHIGQLDIHPSLSVKEEYNDNIYDDDSGETSSAITTYSPGIAFQLPFQRHLLNMDCRAEFIEPARHQNYQTDNYFANIMLDLDFNRLNVQIGDNWARDSVAPDSENDIRNDYYQNRFFLDASYKLADRYKIKGFYRNELRDFNSFHKSWQSDPELDDYTKNEFGFNLFYRFLPLTSALVEYAYTNINNKDMGLPSTDSDTQRLWLGLTWEATSKITGEIKGGYTYRDYDGDIDDFDGFGMKGDIKYQLTSYTTIGLNGFRRPVDTSVTQEEAVYGTYYVSTGGTLSVNHKLTHKISANAHVSYVNDDYEEEGIYNKKRDDDRYGIGVGINYQVQDWLGCEASYSYVDNASNVDVEEYQTNIIAGKISLAF
ncbi:MAG: outer membrane beta-barrel protein [Thermodesulfobacteriota bacterium]|nr:outer membrane beta-barrel protein [Thermodesulfobacteriota bacterium]